MQFPRTYDEKANESSIIEWNVRRMEWRAALVTWLKRPFSHNNTWVASPRSWRIVGLAGILHWGRWWVGGCVCGPGERPRPLLFSINIIRMPRLPWIFVDSTPIASDCHVNAHQFSTPLGKLFLVDVQCWRLEWRAMVGFGGGMDGGWSGSRGKPVVRYVETPLT
jgi:hypothetical protein